MNLLSAATNPVKAIKSELLKVDLDHNKVPDVFQALDAAEAGCDALAEMFADLDPAEAEGMLNAINMFRVSTKRKSGAQIKAAAAKVVLIVPALKTARAALDKTEAELKKG